MRLHVIQMKARGVSKITTLRRAERLFIMNEYPLRLSGFVFNAGLLRQALCSYRHLAE